MSANKKTSLAIGAFILGALLLVFIALLFFSGGRLFAQKERVIMYFDGSVQGLQIGAPVKLKGVILGEITDIQINFQNDDKTVVNAVTADLAMQRINQKGASVGRNFITQAIDNGLRAQLNFQSLLTGLLYVELDFYPDTQPKLFKLQNSYPEIPTVATSFEELSRNFQELNLKELVAGVNHLVAQVNQLVTDGSLQKAVNSFTQAADSVEQTSDNFDARFDKTSAALQASLARADKLLDNLNQQTPQVMNSLNKSLQQLNTSLLSFDQAAQHLSHSVSEDSPLINQLNHSLEDISRAAQSFRSLSETLEQQPEAILRGRNIHKTDLDDTEE